MKRWTRLAAAVIGLAAPATGQVRTGEPAAQSPSGQDEVSPLVRATIFVRDQTKSLALYRDLLGMHVFFDHYWANDGINAIMATHGETLRAVVLGPGDQVFGKLGIYQLDAASSPRRPSSRPTRPRRASSAK